MRRKLRTNDRMQRYGSGRIPVMVTWYTRGSKSNPPERVLRVVLNPDGWHIVGDDYRIDPRSWLDRVRPYTLEDGSPADMDARDAGLVMFANLRKVQGCDLSLPLELGEWPSGRRFYVGSSRGEGQADLDTLRADCRRAVQTRRPVRVILDWANDSRVTWSSS